MNSSGDRLLIVAAIAGMLVYLFLLPAQHPDSVGATELTSVEAREIAAAFLTGEGYSVENLQSKAILVSNVQAISDVQDSLGRSWLLADLDSDVSESMPLYYWSASYFFRADQAGWVPRYTVNLTPSGKVFEFENHSNTYPENSRISVADILGTPQSGVDATTSDVAVDSVESESFEFAQDAFPTGVDSTVAGPVANIEIDDRTGATTVTIGPGGVVKLALYHLERLGTNTNLLEPDSLWLDFDGDNVPAVVKLDYREGVLPLRSSVFVSISPNGSLHDLNTRTFGTDEVGGGDEPTRAELLEIGLFVIPIIGLAFFLLITFFRRLMARLIDIKAALVDALIVAGLVVLALVLQPNLVFGMSSLPTWARLLVPFAIGGFVGGGVAVLTFILSSAADSFARSKLSSNTAAIGLIRRGQLFNGLVGYGLVRGVLAGFVLLGLTTALLWVMPNATIAVDTGARQGNGLLAVVAKITATAVFSYGQIGILLLTVLSLVKRWLPNSIVLFSSGAIFLGAIGVLIPDLDPMGLNILGSVVTGVFLTWLLVRHDVLTSTMALFTASLVWALQDGWLIQGAPTLVYFLIGLGLVAGLLIFGVVGITRGDPIEKVRDYVPEYIRELRSQERLQHELNIAQQVQESFLPQTMPDIPGVDIAARCLAAEEVGGDYYDFVPLTDGRLAIVIGDVSGKGIQAAFFMTLVKGFVRTLCKGNPTPAKVLKRVNELFCENAPKGMFISMIFGILDIPQSRFVFARAGHNPVMIRQAAGHGVSTYQPSGLGIGFVKGSLFDRSVEEVEVHLDKDDLVVLYTDGFSEAMNRSRELFGDDRLRSVIRRATSSTANDLLNDVQESVDTFVEGAERHDDMTMVVLRLPGDS